MAETLRAPAGYFPGGGLGSHGGWLTVSREGLRFDPHAGDRTLTGSRGLRVERDDVAGVGVLPRRWRPGPGFFPRQRMVVHLRAGGSLVFLFNRFSQRFGEVRELLS